ncbi:hypothetical protein Taro_021924, partial [Colocasia esculenta]|nr:hypothetical protein [Colocasia esculenta]
GSKWLEKLSLGSPKKPPRCLHSGLCDAPLCNPGSEMCSRMCCLPPCRSRSPDEALDRRIKASKLQVFSQLTRVFSYLFAKSQESSLGVVTRAILERRTSHPRRGVGGKVGVAVGVVGISNQRHGTPCCCRLVCQNIDIHLYGSLFNIRRPPLWTLTISDRPLMLTSTNPSARTQNHAKP